MDPLGTNMYLLKRYRPSDSFCTFISESVETRIQTLVEDSKNVRAVDQLPVADPFSI